MSDQPWNNDPKPSDEPVEGYEPPTPPPDVAPDQAPPVQTPPPPVGQVPPMPGQTPPSFGATPPPPPFGAPPPAAPYGTPPPAAPYGTPPPAAPYGATPYGATPPPAAPYGATPQPPYGATPPPSYGAAPASPAPVAFGYPLAFWGKRAASWILDGLIAGVPYFVLSVIASIMTGFSYSSGIAALAGILTFLGYLAMLAVWVWNYGYKQGTTGMSFGKSILKLRLVDENTGAPLGFGTSVVRWLAHVIDGAICYIGFLFPLWDAKRQTIADKIMHTVVLDVSSDPNTPQFQWTLK